MTSAKWTRAGAAQPINCGNILLKVVDLIITVFDFALDTALLMNILYTLQCLTILLLLMYANATFTWRIAFSLLLVIFLSELAFAKQPKYCLAVLHLTTLSLDWLDSINLLQSILNLVMELLHLSRREIHQYLFNVRIIAICQYSGKVSSSAGSRARSP